MIIISRPSMSSGSGVLDSLCGFKVRLAKPYEQVWNSVHASPRPLPRGSSFAHINIGLAGLAVSALSKSPTLSQQ